MRRVTTYLGSVLIEYGKIKAEVTSRENKPTRLQYALNMTTMKNAYINVKENDDPHPQYNKNTNYIIRIRN